MSYYQLNRGLRVRISKESIVWLLLVLSSVVVLYWAWRTYTANPIDVKNNVEFCYATLEGCAYE
jgi:hypothetical protein